MSQLQTYMSEAGSSFVGNKRSFDQFPQTVPYERRTYDHSFHTYETMEPFKYCDDKYPAGEENGMTYQFGPWKSLLAAVEVNFKQERNDHRFHRPAPSSAFEMPGSRDSCCLSSVFSPFSGTGSYSTSEDYFPYDPIPVSPQQKKSKLCETSNCFVESELGQNSVIRSNHEIKGRRGPRGKSRFKGVCITRAGKWRAVIYIGRKQRYLGVFNTEVEAAQAYNAHAYRLFKENAELNSFET